MFSVSQAFENCVDYWLCEASDAFGAILEASDEGRHNLETSDLLVEVVGAQVLVSEESDYFLDLSEMTLVSVLGDYDFDVAPGCLPLLFVSA